MTANLTILKNQTQDVLCPSLVNELDTYFQPMSDSLNALCNKTSSIPTAKDAKKVVKSLVADTTMDETMEKIFQISGALFAMSSNYVIATSLLRHPKQYNRQQTTVGSSVQAISLRIGDERLYFEQLRDQRNAYTNSQEWQGDAVVIPRENKQIPKQLQHHRHKGMKKVHQKRKPLKSRRKAKRNSKMYICK